MLDKILNQLLVKVATDSQIGVIITDKDRRTVWVNDYIQKTTGYEADEFIGNSPGKILQGVDTDPEHVAFIREKLEKGESFETEILNYTKDGRKFWVNLQIDPVRNVRNEIEYFLSIQHDITELKEKNEQLENFNYLTTHDFVNQVGNLNNLIGMLSAEGMDEKESEKLKFLKITAKKLRTTTKNLRTLLSFQGKELVLEEVTISEVIDEVCDSLKRQLSEGKVIVRKEVPPTITIRSNRLYLSSIFYNLISNAVKYRDPLKEPQLLIEATQEDKRLILSFEDNGLGMNLKKDPDKLFRAFKTFHSHPDAIGIGLYLTKKQLEILKGSITAESQPKIGTVFTIKLPYFF